MDLEIQKANEFLNSKKEEMDLTRYYVYLNELEEPIKVSRSEIGSEYIIVSDGKSNNIIYHYPVTDGKETMKSIDKKCYHNVLCSLEEKYRLSQLDPQIKYYLLVDEKGVGKRALMEQSTLDKYYINDKNDKGVEFVLKTNIDKSKLKSISKEVYESMLKVLRLTEAANLDHKSLYDIFEINPNPFLKQSPFLKQNPKQSFQNICKATPLLITPEEFKPKVKYRLFVEEKLFIVGYSERTIEELISFFDRNLGKNHFYVIGRDGRDRAGISPNLSKSMSYIIDDLISGIKTSSCHITDAFLYSFKQMSEDQRRIKIKGDHNEFKLNIKNETR